MAVFGQSNEDLEIELNFRKFLAHVRSNPLNLGVIKHIEKVSKFFDKIDSKPTQRNKKAVIKLLGTKPKLIATGTKTRKKDWKNASLAQATVGLDTINEYNRWLPELEYDMTAMVLADGADHLMIGYLLLKGQIEKAAHHASYMDTAPRDCIDEDVWDLLMEHR